MNEAVFRLVDMHAPFLVVTSTNRIECILNGHVFPSDEKAIESFVK